MNKLFSRKNKSGASGQNNGRPLFKSVKKNYGGKSIRIKIFKRRELTFVFSISRKPNKKLQDKYTKFIFSFYALSRFFETAAIYRKKPYLGLRYRNSLSISYLLSVILLIGGLAGAAYFTLDLNSPQEFKPNRTISLPVQTTSIDNEKKKKGLAPSKPKQITITRLGIDYPVTELGQAADGTMETPPLFDKVTGWYKYSPTPGEIGPSVIVGHIDTYKGPSVFWKLREAQPGDEVSVVREDGSTVKFKVTAIKQFEQNNFPTEEVYGNTDDSQLRLITCGGTFDKKTLHYSENTVVFASIVQ